MGIDYNMDVLPGLKFGLKNFGGHFRTRYFFQWCFCLVAEAFFATFAKILKQKSLTPAEGITQPVLCLVLEPYLTIYKQNYTNTLIKQKAIGKTDRFAFLWLVFRLLSFHTPNDFPKPRYLKDSQLPFSFLFLTIFFGNCRHPFRGQAKSKASR